MSVMKTDDESCAGYIGLVFFDDTTNEAVNIGGAGFLSKEECDAAWANVAEFDGESSFQADMMDGQRDIVDDRRVSAETCEFLTGRKIATLIAEGRAKLAAELAGYRNGVATHSDGKSQCP